MVSLYLPYYYHSRVWFHYTYHTTKTVTKHGYNYSVNSRRRILLLFQESDYSQWFVRRCGGRPVVYLFLVLCRGIWVLKYQISHLCLRRVFWYTFCLYYLVDHEVTLFQCGVCWDLVLHRKWSTSLSFLFKRVVVPIQCLLSLHILTYRTGFVTFSVTVIWCPTLLPRQSLPAPYESVPSILFWNSPMLFTGLSSRHWSTIIPSTDLIYLSNLLNLKYFTNFVIDRSFTILSQKILPLWLLPPSRSIVWGRSQLHCLLFLRYISLVMSHLPRPNTHFFILANLNSG